MLDPIMVAAIGLAIVAITQTIYFSL